MLKQNRLYVFAALVALALTSVSQSALAAPTEQIVINYKQNIRTDGSEAIDALAGEAACVAFQIGMAVLGEHKRTAMFVTLNGVYLADQATYDIADTSGFMCATPNGPQMLSTVRDNYFNAGGTMVICPLCWFSRVAPAFILAENKLEQAELPVDDPKRIPRLFSKAKEISF